VGLLNPGNGRAADEIERVARAKLGAGMQGIKVFLVLADQYLEVLREVYGLGDAELKRRDPSDLDSTLTLFLETAN
jgi:hypothetical protein